MADLGIVRNLDKSNKFLFLDGYGVNLRVDDGKLVLRDGKGLERAFFPKRFPYDSVIVYGTRGSITFEAIRWINKHNSQISIMNWDGRLLTSIQPPEAKQIQVKFRQYEAYNSPERVDIARKIIGAKIRRTKDLLLWLAERYPEIDTDIEREAVRLPEARNVPEIMNVEGRVAQIYWEQFTKIVDSKLEFITRKYYNTPFGAVDPVNALLNYGYALLETQCREAINVVGLDTHVGFMHDVTTGKEPLVYDMQEPFRWAVDMAIINSLNGNLFTKKDFIRTENYNIKLKACGAKKLTEEVEKALNMKISHEGMMRTLSYMILLKTRDLSHYLQGKKKKLDFNIKLRLERDDSYEIRQKIIKFPYSKAKKIGMSKGTLWYLKQNAVSDKPFKVYKSVKERFENIS